MYSHLEEEDYERVYKKINIYGDICYLFAQLYLALLYCEEQDEKEKQEQQENECIKAKECLNQIKKLVCCEKQEEKDKQQEDEYKKTKEYLNQIKKLVYCEEQEDKQQQQGKNGYEKARECLYNIREILYEDYYIRQVIDEINYTEEKYWKYLIHILLCFVRMRRRLMVGGIGRNYNSRYEKNVAHYTKFDTAMTLLQYDDKKEDKKENGKKNPFHLSSSAYVNDPSEGQVIFDYLNGVKELKEMNIALSSQSQLATFVGSFAFNHDSLNQFRLYGKENAKEATGISIIIDSDFFGYNQHSNTSNPYGSDVSSENKKQNTTDKKQNTQKSLEKDDKDDKDEYEEYKKQRRQQGDKKLPLYRCIYLDPIREWDKKPYIRIAAREKLTFYRDFGRKEKDWNEYVEYIEHIEEKIVEFFQTIRNNVVELFEKIAEEEKKYSQDKEKLRKLNRDKKELINTVSFILLPLSYMTKHAAYTEEQECRIFRFIPFNHEDIRTNKEQRRMYVEYFPIHNNVKKIYLSSGAERYEDIFSSLVAKVEKSNNPFRG